MSSSQARRSRGRSLRPLDQQVVVITGGSSGIGRETAVRFARAGAAVVVLGRDEDSLQETLDAVAQVSTSREEARAIVCDVSDATAVQAAADHVEQWHGRIDTWVANAGVLMYALFRETGPDEFRRVMEVDFLGQINSALAALPALERAGGGAFISVGSAESVAALPFHSAYAASKSATETALDGLRIELIAARSPVSITTIRPAVIDTPIYTAARNRTGRLPRAPRPYYAPSVVADCILYAAAHRVRLLHAGGGARLIAFAQTAFPLATEQVLGRLAGTLMTMPEPVPPHDGNLDVALPASERRLLLPGRGRPWSGTTWAVRHPLVRRATVLALIVAALVAARRRR